MYARARGPAHRWRIDCAGQQPSRLQARLYVGIANIMSRCGAYGHASMRVGVRTDMCIDACIDMCGRCRLAELSLQPSHMVIFVEENKLGISLHPHTCLHACLHTCLHTFLQAALGGACEFELQLADQVVCLVGLHLQSPHCLALL